MQVSKHVKIRKKLKAIFERLLFNLLPKPIEGCIDPLQIEHILIIRINYRIGNMLFVTPLIEQIQQDLPNVKIDILVGAPFTKVLFSGFKNVNSIYDFSRDLLKHPVEMFKYIRQLRSKHYDVVLNVNGGSTSDKLATLLARAKYKVAFCDDVSYSTANICVKRKLPQTLHEALKPIELVSVFNIEPDYYHTLSIALSEQEILQAKNKLCHIITCQESKKYIGIFRNARFDKVISNKWWKEFVDEMRKIDDTIVFIDVLSPDITEVLDDSMVAYQDNNLRDLAAFMANLDAFICADTGPMHLASASGVPTIALFKTTMPLLYGTLKKSDLSLVMGNKTVSEIIKEILFHLKSI